MRHSATTIAPHDRLSEPAPKEIGRRLCWLRPLVFGSAVFLFIALLAPTVDLMHWSGAMTAMLQRTLGRSVQFEHVHLSVLTGPGLTFENVLIGEDPRYGLEPFAFVPTLEVGLRPDRLLQGRLQPSTFRLRDPSLNLVKHADDTWNLEAFLHQVGTGRRFPLDLLPLFEVESGRVDFKLGERKTTLYLLEADLRVYSAGAGKLRLDISASPARTDRAGNGFGHFRGRITWSPRDASTNAQITLDPSNLSEVATLIEGHDIGVHGTVAMHLQAAGLAKALHITGDVAFSDVHRWDLLPASGEEWRLPFAAMANLPARTISGETVGGPDAPLTARFSVVDFLRSPRWQASATTRRLPLEDVIPLARRMGLDIPPQLSITGLLNGSLYGDSSRSFTGQGEIDTLKAAVPGAPALQADVAPVVLSSDRVQLGPVAVSFGDAPIQTTINLSLVSSALRAAFTTPGMSVEQVLSLTKSWFGTPPALQGLRSGILGGRLTFVRPDQTESDAKESWQGALRFSNATLSLPGLAWPLESSEGAVTLDGERVTVPRFSTVTHGHVVRGSYRMDPRAQHPERLHLEVPAIALDELQALLRPTLERQDWLARLRVSSPAAPPWLAARNMEGDLLIRRFDIGSTAMGPLTARFFWRGANIQVPYLRLHLPDVEEGLTAARTGTLQAQGSAMLASYLPRYQFNAKVQGYRWHGGTIQASGLFRTAGTSMPDLMRNMDASGTFAASDVALTTETVMRSMQGDFNFSNSPGWPELRLSTLRADNDETLWEGSGSTTKDGGLILQMEHEGAPWRIASSLSPELGSR